MPSLHCLPPGLADAKGYDSFQFVRQGYFCVDAKDSKEDALVFNRIVSLKSASPEKMLARGYSITLKDGKVVKDATLLNEKDEILTRFYRGEVTSVVNHKS